MNDSFETWLVKEINNRGWSQAKLAKLAGVSRTSISDALSGKSPAGFDVCIGIAKALVHPPELVLRYAGLLPPAPAHTEQIETLLYLFDQLDEENKKDVLGYIHFRLRS